MTFIYTLRHDLHKAKAGTNWHTPKKSAKAHGVESSTIAVRVASPKLYLYYEPISNSIIRALCCCFLRRPSHGLITVPPFNRKTHIAHRPILDETTVYLNGNSVPYCLSYIERERASVQIIKCKEQVIMKHNRRTKRPVYIQFNATEQK